MAIKYGFLIEDNKIFDTKVQSYVEKRVICDKNVIYTMSPVSYKRLYLFEALLSEYSIEKVFEILNYNKSLKKDRCDEISDCKNHYMTNSAVIYNYPPTYLTMRKFQLYKTCQKLKKKID
jgi:hypothetical protein